MTDDQELLRVVQGADGALRVSAPEPGDLVAGLAYICRIVERSPEFDPDLQAAARAVMAVIEAKTGAVIPPMFDDYARRS
jgi:hypothetical protein